MVNVEYLRNAVVFPFIINHILSKQSQESSDSGLRSVFSSVCRECSQRDLQIELDTGQAVGNHIKCNKRRPKIHVSIFN